MSSTYSENSLRPSLHWESVVPSALGAWPRMWKVESQENEPMEYAPGDSRIAYFSMEIGLEEYMPTYSGGLGILAGDTVRAAADLKIPLVAVTLLHRKGYFYQRLENGQQQEEPVYWSIDDFVTEMPQRTTLTLEGRSVTLRAWRYTVHDGGGFCVPVYLLDTDVPENTEWDRHLTDFLYGGDLRYRLCQEVILGIGGVRMLRSLGYTNLTRFHMNEGHASLLALELLEEHVRRHSSTTVTHQDIDVVRQQCVFTTHTPVPAGHDQFPMELVHSILDHEVLHTMQDVFCCDGTLNMTFLGFNLSHYINGVAKKHGEIARLLFAQYRIDSITNGVHAPTWTAPKFRALFDRHIPGWREDNFSLRYALSIPSTEIWDAHQAAKRELINNVNRTTNSGMDADVFTIGFARRSTPYKRADLLFTDLERLQTLATQVGQIQIIYAGKAHPHDQAGKELIVRIHRAIAALQGRIKVVYLANYDMTLGALMTAGVDLWLNTPQPPMEASGTSGMKAAMNGVPSLSVLDGWWIEGCLEGVTGWAIGTDQHSANASEERSQDAQALYDKLEQVILPMYYHDRERFVQVMRQAIALNGSFFNTQRMMQQYVVKAYFL